MNKIITFTLLILTGIAIYIIRQETNTAILGATTESPTVEPTVITPTDYPTPTTSYYVYPTSTPTYQNYGWYTHNGSSMQYVNGSWYPTPQQNTPPTQAPQNNTPQYNYSYTNVAYPTPIPPLTFNTPVPAAPVVDCSSYRAELQSCISLSSSSDSSAGQSCEASVIASEPSACR